MAKFNIPCYWQAHGILEVEADTLREAIEKAQTELGLPKVQDFVDGSFQVDFEGIPSFNDSAVMTEILYRPDDPLLPNETFFLKCVCGRKYLANIYTKDNCRGVDSLINPDCPGCGVTDTSVNLVQKPS